MRILITGGTGFIGSFVVEELLSKGHEVVIIGNGRQLPVYLEESSKKIAYYQGDFGETDVLDKALSGCNAVIHLAWSTVPKQTKGATAFEFSSNISSSINLIEKAIDFNIDKFIFISSGGTVYGIPELIPIPELHKSNPISNYGLSKLTTEKLFHLYHYSSKIKYTVLRISNAYGERQNLYKNQGVIGVWLKNILQKQEIEIWGDGSVIRDYVYVKDVASAIVKALHSVNGAEIFNIGSGQGITLNEIMLEMRKIVGLSFDVIYKPSRDFDVPVNVLDISKAKESLGYCPSTNLHDGISRTWEWLCSQKIFK